MPVVDYKKTIIYKIQHETKDDLLYVGSTTHFGNRKVQHKQRCYNANQKIYNSKIYTTIRDNGGWDAFNMVIVKEFPCENKRQAEAEEDRIMREMKASLNMVRAYTTEEEKQEKKKEYDKVYNECNKEKKKEQKHIYYMNNIDKRKEYIEKNIDIIKEKRKEYREQHKDTRNEYNKEYYYQNRDKVHEKHTCPCGGRYTYQHKASHFKSKKHQTFINQQTEQ